MCYILTPLKLISTNTNFFNQEFLKITDNKNVFYKPIFSEVNRENKKFLKQINIKSEDFSKGLLICKNILKTGGASAPPTLF